MSRKFLSDIIKVTDRVQIAAYVRHYFYHAMTFSVHFVSQFCGYIMATVKVASAML